MDNFSKPRRSYRRPHAVDGFITPGRTPTDSRAQFNTSYRPAATQQHAHSQATSAFFAAQQPAAYAPQDTKAPLEDVRTRRSKRKKRIKTKHSPLKRVMRALFVLLIITGLTVGGIAGYGFIKARQVFTGGGSAAALEKNVDPVKLKGEGDGRINIVLYGIGGEGHDGAYLTDTIVIASIDPVQNEAALLSIPRDLWVKQENGSYTKINAVYAFERERVYAQTKNNDAATKAAAAASEKVISSVIGIPVNYFLTVDFNGFERAIDTVGGVDINVPSESAVKETLWDEATHKNYYLNVPAGQQHFDGIRALYYSRSRHTSPRGDFDRSERQRQVLLALKEKVQSVGTYANPVKVTQLLSAFGDHVRTDLTINEMMRLYDISKGITPDKVVSVGLADPPQSLVTTSNIDGLSVVVPRAGVGQYDAIHSFVRNNLKDAFLKNENASVLILNGTSIDGLAGKKSAELKSYGYNVVGAASAPTKTYTKTALVDLSGGTKKYTKNYLEKRFGVTAVTSLPDTSIASGGANFVIILGTDANTTSSASSQ